MPKNEAAAFRMRLAQRQPSGEGEGESAGATETPAADATPLADATPDTAATPAAHASADTSATGAASDTSDSTPPAVNINVTPPPVAPDAAAAANAAAQLPARGTVPAAAAAGTPSASPANTYPLVPVPAGLLPPGASSTPTMGKVPDGGDAFSSALPANAHPASLSAALGVPPSVLDKPAAPVMMGATNTPLDTPALAPANTFVSTTTPSYPSSSPLSPASSYRAHSPPDLSLSRLLTPAHIAEQGGALVTSLANDLQRAARGQPILGQGQGLGLGQGGQAPGLAALLGGIKRAGQGGEMAALREENRRLRQHLMRGGAGDMVSDTMKRANGNDSNLCY